MTSSKPIDPRVRLAIAQFLVATEGESIIVTTPQGEVLAEHTRPAAGVTYVGNGRPKGRWRDIPNTSPKS